MASWKELRDRRRYDRLTEAIKNGYLEADEIEPDYIEIPEEPDRKWTDKPSGQAAG
jgi:hypothetical protein